MAYCNRLLVIENDAGVALALYRELGSSYKVEIAKTATSGLRKAETKLFDLIILDLGLPDMPGLSACKALRACNNSTPILVLTGRGDTASKVSLLDAGADDYITKPFSLEELKARIRVALRQIDASTLDSNRLVAGHLVLDRLRHRVEHDGVVVALRRKEFSILECLMSNMDSVVTRSHLMSYAWDDQKASLSNAVNVHVNHLRKKLSSAVHQPLIHTIHGVGYKLDGGGSS